MKKQQPLIKRVLNFIKYHNAFTIGLVLALFGGGAIFAASPDARSAVVGEEVVTAQGVDNTQIFNADLDNFDFQMKINNVTEDETNYYVDYSFQTIGVEANVWKTITRNLQMIVSRGALAGQDLGLYAQKQLASIADNELAYLKQAQAAERGKGQTEIVRTTDYTGLIGLVLDVKNAILPGYEPVIKPEPVELAQNTEAQTLQEQPQNSPELDLPVTEVAATTTEEIAETQPENPAPIAEESEAARNNATSTIPTP